MHSIRTCLISSVLALSVLSRCSAQGCTDQTFDGEYSDGDLDSSGATFTGWTNAGNLNEGFVVRAGQAREWALGVGFSNPSDYHSSNRPFVNNETIFWRLWYDDQGRTSATGYPTELDRTDDTNANVALNWHAVVGDGEQPLRIGGAIELVVSASAGVHSQADNVQPGEYVEVTLQAVTIPFDGTPQALDTTLRAENPNELGQMLHWYYADARLSEGFYLDGSVTFSWDGVARTTPILLGDRLSFSVSSGNLTAPPICEGLPCSDCHRLAWCDPEAESPICVCPEGTIGDGTDCSTQSWSVRTVMSCENQPAFLDALWPTIRQIYVDLLVGPLDPFKDQMLNSAVYGMEADVVTGFTTLTIYSLFTDKTSAESSDLDAVLSDFANQITLAHAQAACEVEAAPTVYTYVTGTSSDPLPILPSGLQIDDVWFDTDCMSAGCWVIDVFYTTGKENSVNTLFLPRAEAADNVSSPEYSTIVEDSFFPALFPCQTGSYVPDPSQPIPPEVTLCCLPEFAENYRAHVDFHDWVLEVTDTSLQGCNESTPPNSDILTSRTNSILGSFEGLPLSTVSPLGKLNDKANEYAARLRIDERELRSMAGMREGTTGVEYTVDTYVGLASFVPIGGLAFADPFVTQQRVHVEKTDIFTVATHGTNDLTFVDNVKTRLHEVRNPNQDPVHFVQLTFTLGDKYSPNDNEGIVPLDSVRVAISRKKSSARWDHACIEDGLFTGQLVNDFSRNLDQDCAPSISLCTPPATIVDSFVNLNIPLPEGLNMEQLAEQSRNVYVDLVVSALDTTGARPLQMKTTVSAAMPIVRAGVALWCDRVEQAADLLQVATADLIVGSAGFAEELERLRVFENISSSALSSVPPQRIDTDSIESGLMTLVLKGDNDYFNVNPVSRTFSLELEDVITVHIMEESNTTYANLMTLLNAGDMFDIVFNRELNRAELEPSVALFDFCSVFPRVSPIPGQRIPSCIIRRDVAARAYPALEGSVPTAMELPTLLEDTAGASSFIQTIFGESEYADALGRNYSRLVAEKYALDGRSMRAYFINPGYEWTPQQTGGQSLFRLSQRIVLFALIGMDEGFGQVRRRMLLAAGDEGSSVLPLQGNAAGYQASSLEFVVKPTQILADVYEVDVSQVASWTVVRLLTPEEACLSVDELRALTEAKLEQVLPMVATPVIAATIGSVNYDLGFEVFCEVPSGGSSVDLSDRRRALKDQRRAGDPIADMEMVIVFEAPEEGGRMAINTKLLQSLFPALVDIISITLPDEIEIDETLDLRPEEPDEAVRTIKLAMYIGIAAAGAIILAVIAFAFYRRAQKQKGAKKLEEQATEEAIEEDHQKSRKLSDEGAGLSQTGISVHSLEEQAEEHLLARQAVELLPHEKAEAPSSTPSVVHGDLVLEMPETGPFDQEDLEDEHEAVEEVPVVEEDEEVPQETVMETIDTMVINALSGAMDGDVPAPPMEPPRRRAFPV